MKFLGALFSVCERNGDNLFCSGIKQHPSRFTQGSTSGNNVINEDDVATDNFWSITDTKGISWILEPIFTMRDSCLTFCSVLPF
jgi:hypothetical protein